MMNYNNFDDLVEALKENVSTYAKCYQEHMNKIDEEFYVAGSRPTQIEEPMKKDLMQIFDSDFEKVANCFKSNLTTFFNKNFKTLGADLSGYIVFTTAILAHTEIRYQYNYLKMPFGYKDKDKYDKKMNTFLKKYNTGRIKFFIQPALSPYEMIKFFNLKILTQIDMDCIDHFYTVKRDKEKLKKELVLELEKIILCDTTSYLQALKTSHRITNTNKLTYQDTLANYKEALNSKIKMYIIKP